ncbi:hypothetical protein CEUSTIGMA_g11076.t1 [Chlamydomonas eustigma]|uniref:Alanine--tRNA ligase n=1 Tax=Chlamydomonas eustigma TaxID=1157962 RepID=A0A250XKN0_9CHLO|nr:hypothetical protein CEUSTIGMA_g11076.t1 [Chlamydomonas eustigma]|eukprot:GAX83651.1 hypothetical protein CEUSTIGMA_g11076.t1 [Chlamydomonas eustigma]
MLKLKRTGASAAPHMKYVRLGSMLRPSLISFSSISCTRCHLAPPGTLRLPANKQRARAIFSTTDASVAFTTSVLTKETSSPAVMNKMSGAEIRERFLSFFEERGHSRLPSSSLVPEDPTVLLTIAGMLQFKPVFLGQVPRKVPTATTTQKCVRTNDIENVGVTARHHTFFEMLGNFSFGDYFKKEAIGYAWDLSTRVFSLPADRVWVSVYEEDEEALTIWRDVVGVPPERIKKMGAADNFWASGPTGPCGPCSELYFDFHPEQGTAESVTLEDDSRFIEFYNIVFMELNRDAAGKLEPLAAKNIDTGMGLERMAQILQGVPNNYETDLIFPIVQRAAQLAGIDYHAADPLTKTALKVIGDHTRAVTYLISDGVTPSNIGRGYIVRRLLRRVVMKGRLLGIRTQFTSKVAEVAVSLSAACDPQVAAQAQRIYDVLALEEGAFSATLERGQKILEELLAKAAVSKVLSGPDAFLLYDTFGFPLELTQELAEQQGIQVDTVGFSSEMEAQRQRSKDSREDVDLTATVNLSELVQAAGPTTFTGYEALKEASHKDSSGEVTGHCSQPLSKVVALIVEGQQVQEAAAGSRVDVLLDSTPFYAESGGQVSDHGIMVTRGGGPENVPETTLLVSGVKKAAGGALFVHSAKVASGTIRVGSQVSAQIDVNLRRRITSHHTATHLLQSALKKVLGADTCQQGSLVDGERLRFDFNLTRAMTADEVSDVERLVNSWVATASPLKTSVMGLSEAKAAGATAMFGEKYDDVVRVVDVPGISMELCGGTHVSNTAEIGAFKILSESGIASGVRRIEAVAGAAAVEHLSALDNIVRAAASTLKVKSEEVPTKVASLQSELKAAVKEVTELKNQLAVYKAQALLTQAVTLANGLKGLVAELPDVDPKAMQEAAVGLQASLGEHSAVVLGTTRSEAGSLLGAASPGSANFVAVFGPKAIASGLQAGKVVGAVAKVCGGGGGGKPGLAQAGGKDVSKFGEAMELARSLVLAEGETIKKAF